MKHIAIIVVLCAAVFFTLTDEYYTSLREDPETYCQEVGQLYSVSPELLQAILESKYRSSALTGPMKLNKDKQKARMDRLGIHNLNDRDESLEIAADYLLYLFEKYEDEYTVLQIYFEFSEKYNSESARIIGRAYRLEDLHGKRSY